MLMITSSDLESILLHSRHEFPREACGIMKGRRDMVDGERMTEVLNIYRTQNIHRNPLRGYTIHPMDQYRVYVELDTDLELVGFYHSHPHGPQGPSTTDIDECNYHGYAFLIVSLVDVGNPDVSAWILYDDRVEKQKIVILN
jgi:proteasome lid subunit RPN8/RPN11